MFLVKFKLKLPFRGYTEGEIFIEESELSVVEMLSKYGRVLQEYIMRLNHSACKLTAPVLYLTSKAQNAFGCIQLRFFGYVMRGDKLKHLVTTGTFDGRKAREDREVNTRMACVHDII